MAALALLVLVGFVLLGLGGGTITSLLGLAVVGGVWIHQKRHIDKCEECRRKFSKKVGPRPSAASTRTAAASRFPLARGVKDVADELRELARLRQEGLLTDDEFDSKKKRLLHRM